MNCDAHIHRSPSALIAAQGARLRALVGERLHRSWIAWDASADTWWPDEAIVLQIGERQLELCCLEIEWLAVSWGSIQLETTPRYVADWDENRLEWREDAHAVLARVRGATLQSIQLIQGRLRVWKDAGDWEESWGLGGLELSFSTGIVRVVNGLDGNELESDPDPGPHRLRTPL